LLLLKKDDMGLTLMGMMFLDDQYPPILEVFNKMDILKENDSALRDFASDLINNLAYHLRKNKMLKAMKVFVKALNHYPGVGLAIFRNFQ
jgi:hypothetical protein